MTESCIMRIYYVNGTIQITSVSKPMKIDFSDDSYTIYRENTPNVCINLNNVMFVQWLTNEEYEAEKKAEE